MSLFNAITKLFLHLLSLLPLKVTSILGNITGWLLYVYPNRHKKITLINLELAFPHLSNEEIMFLCRRSLIETSKTLYESGYVWVRLPGNKLPKSIKIEGFEKILESLNQGGGLILFTPHQANIEILINYLGKNIDCSVPFSKIKNKYLNGVVEEARSKMGVNMVEANISGVKDLITNLKKGKAVAIASDQVPVLSGGELSEFFGQKCLSMSLLWKLQFNTKARIHSMVCIREAKGEGFRIIFSQPLEMPSTIKEGVDTMNKELEKCIMLAPEQYAWEYKKYRRAGIENPYK